MPKISKNKLNSFSKDILSDTEIKFIQDKVSPLLDYLLKEYFILEDSIYNPFGLYNHARNISYKIGTHYYTKLNPDDRIPDITAAEYAKLEKPDKEKYKWGSYVLKDSNIHPFIITDHIARISPEKDKSLHQTLSDWSFGYCRKIISKNWKWNVINIMQQTVYSENKSYSFKNELNWEALKPSLADLGDNKLVAQDHHVVLGNFNPFRYASNGKIDGIDLAKSNGKYRSTKILKNRNGEDQIEIPWYFDGAVGDWKELNWDSLDEFYALASK